MTDLSPAERAVVERFERAPDALGEVALTDDQYRTFAVALCLWWDGQGEAEACHVDDDARPCGACGEEADALAPVAARMVAEAADAREAEVRAEWADYFEHWSGAVGPEPLTVPLVIAALRAKGKPFGCAALAPADNDGEARHD